MEFSRTTFYFRFVFLSYVSLCAVIALSYMSVCENDTGLFVVAVLATEVCCYNCVMFFLEVLNKASNSGFRAIATRATVR